jgi:four helix bundle protein
MLNLSHKKLDIWKLSISFIKEIYKLTENFLKSELYGLTSQMKRAAVSVTSNIAEGSARSSAIERKRFYEISRSSLIELDTQLEFGSELGYVDKAGLSEFNNNINTLFAKITNFISTVK